MATKAVGQITVFDYSDGYSVMLTNPSYTFMGDEDSVRGVQSVTTRVVAMQGASQINASVDTSQIIKPTGFTVTSNGATPSPTLTIQANQSVTDAGVLTIPVTVATGVTVSLQWSYSIAFTGGKGDTGDAGRGVTGTTVQYAPGTLPTTPPSSGWDDTVPSVDEGKYLWVKTVFTYSSGDPVTTYSVAKQGEKGSTGNGISSTVVEYAESTSGVTPPTTIASWGSDIPNVAQGNYLWTRTTTNYTGSNPTVSYSVARIGMDGEPATTYSLIVSHAAIAKSASGTFSPTSITLTAKSQTGTNAYANYSGRFKIEVYNGSSWSTKYTSSSNENTKSYTIPSGTTQVRCSLYLAGGTTTLLDQQTIPVVSDGAAGGDAYTIILDNESHTFAGGTGAAIAGTATVNVYAYKGATAIAPTVMKSSITGLPTGMTVKTVTNDSTNKKSTIVFQVTTSMVTRSGLVTIPVVADGKTFSKTFSYALALKGDTGVSISSVTNYYLATSASSGVTTSTSGWTTTVQTMDATKQYLWNYEVVSGSDGSTLNTTTPVIIGRYGQNGGKGDTGRGITSITEHYQVSSSNSTAPTTWSDTMVNTTATNKYLWNYETITYTDGTTEDSTKRVIGTHGEKGDTGASISSVANYYLASASSSGVTTSTSGWTTNPTASAATMTSTKQYLWNYEVIKDSNNTTITTTSPVIIGRYGQNGGTGSAGKGITGITEYYLATSASSGVTTSTSGWTTAVQSTTATNKYLWNYEVISYTSGNPYTSDPRIIGTYGDKGDKGNKGDKGDKGDKGVGVTSITKTGTSGKVDTYTIKYTDNTSTTFAVTNGTNGTNGTSAEWFYGTALTHTSGTATATISGAKVGDMYLNTATSNVYKCTAANTWTYAGNIADGVIDNISIGGRNLFGYGSDCQKTLAGMSQDSGNLFSIVTEDGYLCAHASGRLQKTARLYSKLRIIPKPNEPVVISCYVKIKNIVRGTTNPMCELYVDGQTFDDGYWYSTRARKTYLDGKLIDASSGLAFDRAITDEKWHHFAISAVYYNKQYDTPILGAVYFRDATGDLYVRNIKFERGNIATDWTPAPEDATAYTDNAVNSIEVGGRNLVLNTAGMPAGGSGGWRASGGTVTHVEIANPPISGITGGIRVTNNGSSATRIGLAQDNRYNTFVAGEKYSQSFWIRASSSFASTVDCQPVWISSGQTTGSVGTSMTLTTSWQYVKGEGKTLNGAQSNYYSAGYAYASNVPAGGYIEICANKVEKGNKATDWTPAPEDVDASIATAQATADRKKQTFITTPTTPYYVGDTYFVNGKLLVCHTERLTGSYTADDWSEDLGYASSDTVATLEASTKTELDTIRSEASANYTSLSDSLDKIQASFNTQVEQTSEDFSIRINGLLESLTSLANDTSTKFAEYSKYFRFTADGLEIGEESNALTLVLDNDKISFRRNGVEFSYWDGSDNSFHVGDIIVDVNQVARFGSFGLVPLEGGDLAWKWLGSST